MAASSLFHNAFLITLRTWCTLEFVDMIHSSGDVYLSTVDDTSPITRNNSQDSWIFNIALGFVDIPYIGHVCVVMYIPG